MPEWVWLIAVLVGYVILTQCFCPSWEFPLEGALAAPSLGEKIPTRPLRNPPFNTTIDQVLEET